MIVIGSDKVGVHGAHGSEKHVPIYHFFYWHECETFLRQMKGCKIYGIVDSIDAKRIQAGVTGGDSSSNSSSCGDKTRYVKDVNNGDVRFDSSAAFIATGGSRRFPGGLTSAQDAVCDELLTIRFPKKEFEFALDYDVYLSIILERYSSVMAFHQRSFVGEKFFSANITPM